MRARTEPCYLKSWRDLVCRLFFPKVECFDSSERWPSVHRPGPYTPPPYCLSNGPFPEYTHLLLRCRNFFAGSPVPYPPDPAFYKCSQCCAGRPPEPCCFLLLPVFLNFW